MPSSCCCFRYWNCVGRYKNDNGNKLGLLDDGDQACEHEATHSALSTHMCQANLSFEFIASAMLVPEQALKVKHTNAQFCYT